MTSDLKLRIFGRLSEVTPHLLHQLAQNIRIRNTQKDQYSGGNRSTDDASDSTERAEFRADGCSCCSHHDGRDDDNAIQVSLDTWNECSKAKSERVERGKKMELYVEWPKEKNVPTATGFWPVATRRRVTRSMMVMWSASIA